MKELILHQEQKVYVYDNRCAISRVSINKDYISYLKEDVEKTIDKERLNLEKYPDLMIGEYRTIICFTGGETIKVLEPFDEVRRRLQDRIAR